MGCRLCKPKRGSVKGAAPLPSSLRSRLPTPATKEAEPSSSSDPPGFVVDVFPPAKFLELRLTPVTKEGEPSSSSTMSAPSPPAPTPSINIRDMDDTQIICPIDAEWKFYKSDLMDIKKGGKVGKCYYAYNIPGLQYYVKILPNGIHGKYLGQTWMAYRVNGSNETNVVSELTFSIESANFSYRFNHVYKAGDMLRLDCLDIYEYLDSKSKYFVDGILTVKVKGVLKVPRPMISKITSPISYQWKINEKDLKAKKHSKGTLRSKSIDVPTFSNTKYYLEICPRKTKDSGESRAFLYLKTESGAEKKIKAVYDFSVDSARVSRGKKYVCEGSDYCGVNLCPTKVLFDPAKRFIVNGYLTINVNGILMTEKNHFIIFKCKNDLAPEPPKMNEKDFLIVAGDTQIHAHKQVLVDVSPVVAKMFKLGTIKNRIKIKGFSSKVVDAAIKLCYSADESFEFTLEDMLSLFRFGKKYRMKLVMDIAGDYLIQDISPSNVVYLIKFSLPVSFNIVKLHQSCLDFLTKSLKKSTPIYALESLDKDVMVKMLSNHPNLDTSL